MHHVSSEGIFMDFALSGLSFLSPSGYRVYSERIITDFAFSGFVFSSLRAFALCLFIENFTGFALSGFVFSFLRVFTLCLLIEKYHELFPQWLCIFIPQRIYTVSSPRELSRILPSVAFHFHPLEDL
jgi:hypothetical protein